MIRSMALPSAPIMTMTATAETLGFLIYCCLAKRIMNMTTMIVRAMINANGISISKAIPGFLCSPRPIGKETRPPSDSRVIARYLKIVSRISRKAEKKTIFLNELVIAPELMFFYRLHMRLKLDEPADELHRSPPYNIYRCRRCRHQLA